MSPLDWHGLVPEDIRERMLKGRVPRLTSSTKPPYKAGDRIVLEWGRLRDLELAAPARYPHRWISVVKVSRIEGGWIIGYSPPEKGSLYLRRGGGTTPDRMQSIDREVEVEDFDPHPSQYAANPMSQVRQRVVEHLEVQERRFREGSPASRTRLHAVMAATQAKLTALDEAA